VHHRDPGLVSPVRARVAPTRDYRIHTKTHSGDVSDGLATTPDGTHKTDASTVSGDVLLTAR
jgi:hypothetical protein